MSNTPIRAEHHHLRAMVARDPGESHRTATTLELLYDLTLVVAFGTAGSALAHDVAANHIVPAIAAFFFIQFASVWAWMGYTRFASAFDTDDWFVRIAVMVQMVGVLILALGIPELFHGFVDGWQIHNRILVIGYVVMRLPLIALWLRAAKADPGQAKVCRSNATGIAIAQVGWILSALVHLPTAAAWVALMVLYVMELSLPYATETRLGGTRWHPHHLAERYGLLAIIALGEGIIGTFASLEALYTKDGWSPEVIAVLFSGVAVTVGMWWVYFSIPFADILARHRDRVIWFTYPHIIIYAAIAAVGAGLHVAAYYAEGKTTLSLVATMATIVIPLAIFVLGVYFVYEVVLREHEVERFHLLLLMATMATLALSVVFAAKGASLGTCLVIATLAPWVSVIGFETLGYRHVNERLERSESLV